MAKTFEVEQKFRVAAFNSLVAKLLSLGARRQPGIEQVDTYFAHPQRDFGQTDEALRLRRVGEDNFVTYKGPKIDAETKTRRELELPLAAGSHSAAQFRELFQLLSFQPVLEVLKTRQPWLVAWQGTEVEVVLDEVVGLGTFVELELGAETDGLDTARAQLAALAAELGLTEVERRSYLELLLEAHGANP